MTEATYDQQRAAQARRARLHGHARAARRASSATAQTWSGDNTTSWHTLRWNQRMALTMSLSGMFNIGHDIGGFFGPVPDAELLIRWTQACCLRAAHDHELLEGRRQRQHAVAASARRPTTIREAVRLRLQLMPYLYTLMWQARAAAPRPCCGRRSSTSPTTRAAGTTTTR